MANVGSLSFDDNLLGPGREEFFDPAKNQFTDTVVTKLEKALVRHFVDDLRKV